MFDASSRDAPVFTDTSLPDCKMAPDCTKPENRELRTKLDAMLKAEKDPRETGNAAIFDTYQYLGNRAKKGYAEWEARQKGLLPPEEPKKGKKGKKTDE